MSPHVDEKVCDDRTNTVHAALDRLTNTCERINEKLEIVNIHEVKIKHLEKVVYGVGSFVILALIGMYLKG